MTRFQSGGSTQSHCPFINRNDTRCSTRFTLGRIAEAFGVCLNHHETCPTYQRILREQGESINPGGQRHQYAVLTLKGQSYRRSPELRPTGT